MVNKVLAKIIEEILIADFWAAYKGIGAWAKPRYLLHLFTELSKVDSTPCR